MNAIKPDVAEVFYKNVEWFVDFYRGLAYVLGRVWEKMRASRHLDGLLPSPTKSLSLGAYKAGETLPEPYFAFCPDPKKRGARTSVFVGAVLRRDWDSQRLKISSEPMLIVVAHNLRKDAGQPAKHFSEVAKRILTDTSLEDDSWRSWDDNLKFRGAFYDKNHDRVRFSGFLVRLCLFGGNCVLKGDALDHIIDKEIMNELPRHLDRVRLELDERKDTGQ